MIAEIVTLVSEREPESETGTGISETACERMGHLLEESGYRVLSERRLRPEARLLEQVVSESLELFDLVLILDPSDQGGEKAIRKVFAQVSGSGLVLVEGLFEDLKSYYRDKGMELPRDIETRALLPKNAHWVSPRIGVRPGIWMEIRGKYLLVLPDEALEVDQMWEQVQGSWFGRDSGLRYKRRFMTLSFVSRMPAKVESILERSFGQAIVRSHTEGCLLRVTLVLEGKDAERIERDLERVQGRVLEDLEEEYLGRGEESLEQVTGRLLIENSKSIAIAESCTGGFITSLLVDVPGISSVLDRGVVTYSNEAKGALLGVPEEIFKAHGAVSRVTARSMAEGVRKEAGTEIGLAVTGIAGPGGGTLEKPVGTVFIGLSTPEGSEVTEYRLQGDRKAVRLQSAQMALDRVRRYLLGF